MRGQGSGETTHPELPDNWEMVTLGDVCQKPQYGYTTKAAKTGKTKLLRTTDITSGEIRWEDVPFCSKEPDDVDKFRLRNNDIVVSRAGSVGVSHLVKDPERSVFASYLIRFLPYINPDYVRYFLESPLYWANISEQKRGIAVPNVNAAKLSKIQIPVAPDEEQRRIVAKIEELFSELDNGVQSLKAARAQLKTYRQSLLKAAFEGRLTAQSRKNNAGESDTADRLLERIREQREAQHEREMEEWQAAAPRTQRGGATGTKRKKPSRLNEIPEITDAERQVLPTLPERWRYTRLSNVAAVGSGMSVSKSRQPDKPIEIPYLRVANVQRGRLELDSIKHILNP